MKSILKEAILVIIATLLMLAFATLAPTFLAKAHAGARMPAQLAPTIETRGFCADPDVLVQALYASDQARIIELAEQGQCLLLNKAIHLHVVGVTSVILDIGGDPFIIIKGVVDGYPHVVYSYVRGEKMINYIYTLVRGVDA